MTIRHLILAACLAAFSPFVFIACGDVEDTSPDVTDSGHADVGIPDAPIGADTSFDGHTEDTFYEELCEECFERGVVECPEFDQFLSWSEDKALPSVGDAADELCPEVPVGDPCEDFYEIEDFRWTCERTGLSNHVFVVDDHEGVCYVQRVEDSPRLEFEYIAPSLTIWVAGDPFQCTSS